MHMLSWHCRESLLGKGIAPVLKARSAETWVEWALPGDDLLALSCHEEPLHVSDILPRRSDQRP